MPVIKQSAWRQAPCSPNRSYCARKWGILILTAVANKTVNKSPSLGKGVFHFYFKICNRFNYLAILVGPNLSQKKRGGSCNRTLLGVEPFYSTERSGDPLRCPWPFMCDFIFSPSGAKVPGGPGSRRVPVSIRFRADKILFAEGNYGGFCCFALYDGVIPIFSCHPCLDLD